MDHEPQQLGNRGFDDAGRAEAARVTQQWQEATSRSHDPGPVTDQKVRERLGHQARVVSSTGGSPTGGWERMAERARLAQRPTEPVSRYFDPDTVEAEDRRFGPATSVAKFHPNA